MEINQVKPKPKKTWNLFSIIFCSLLAIYSLSILVVLCWGLLTSFKSITDFKTFGNVIGLPDIKWSQEEMQFKNYLLIFKRFSVKTFDKSYYSDIFGKIEILEKRVGFVELLFNTLIYAVMCAFVHSFATFLGAYLCAKYRYWFSNFFYSLLLVIMIIPIVGTGPASLVLLRNTGLYSTYLAMIILNFNCTGMYFFVYYAYAQGISDSYIEAAEIDGASQTRIFFTIIIPLASKILLTVMLLTFITLWNDYQTPLLYYPDKPTLAYAVYSMANSSGASATISTTGLPQKVAGCMILAIPLIVLFITCRNMILGNLSMGGLKE
jgi:ABC-type glycerol-3-phosphate transport system permease component